VSVCEVERVCRVNGGRYCIDIETVLELSGGGG